MLLLLFIIIVVLVIGFEIIDYFKHIESFNRFKNISKAEIVAVLKSASWKLAIESFFLGLAVGLFIFCCFWSLGLVIWVFRKVFRI
jgi:hypothetical protein